MEMVFSQEKIRIGALFKCIILLSLIFSTRGICQKGPDSVKTEYFASGKKKEEVYFVGKNITQRLNFYEGGGLKESWYFDSRNKLSLHRYIALGSKEKTEVYYRKNGLKKEQLVSDSTGLIMKEFIFDCRGRLVETSTLEDEAQSVYKIEKYDRKGKLKKTYYVYPKGTTPVLVK